MYSFPTLSPRPEIAVGRGTPCGHCHAFAEHLVLLRELPDGQMRIEPVDPGDGASVAAAEYLRGLVRDAGASVLPSHPESPAPTLD